MKRSRHNNELDSSCACLNPFQMICKWSFWMSTISGGWCFCAVVRKTTQKCAIICAIITCLLAISICKFDDLISGQNVSTTSTNLYSTVKGFSGFEVLFHAHWWAVNAVRMNGIMLQYYRKAECYCDFTSQGVFTKITETNRL